MEGGNSVAPEVDRWWAGSAAALMLAQLLLSGLAVFQTTLSSLSIASCTATSCDYSAFSATLNTLYIGAVVLLIASTVAVTLLRAHGRAMIWPPIVCSFLLILLLMATYAAGRAALTLPLFGNRLLG